jgi:hypothetical protein
MSQTRYTFSGLSINQHYQQHSQNSNHIDPQVSYHICYPPDLVFDYQFSNFWNWICELAAVFYTSHTQQIFNTIISSNYNSQQQLRRHTVQLLNTITYRDQPLIEHQTYLITSFLNLFQETRFNNSIAGIPLYDNSSESSESPDKTPEDLTITLEDFQELQQDRIIIQAEESEHSEPITKIEIMEDSEFQQNIAIDGNNGNGKGNGVAQIIQAIGQLVNVLGTWNQEKHLIPIKKFRGENQDPIEWLRDFEVAAEANNISYARRLQIVRGYLEGAAAAWFDAMQADEDTIMIYWANRQDHDHSFSVQFT